MALEGQIRFRHIVDVKALQHFGNDVLGGIALLYHVGNRVDLLQIGFEFADTFFRGIRQWLDKETARPDALEVRIHQHAQADTRRRLLGNIEVLCQIVGNFAIGDFAAARNRIPQSCKARHGYCAVRADTAAHINLALVVKRQVHMRVAHITAHITFRRSIGSHNPQRAATVKLHRQGFLILEVGGQQERACHGAPQGCCRHRIAVMAADGLIY